MRRGRDFVLLFVLLLCLPLCVRAQQVGLSGPQSVRPGEQVTVTVSVSRKMLGFSGILRWDKERGTLEKIVSPHTGWQLEIQANHILALAQYEKQQTENLPEEVEILQAVFTVSEQAVRGETFSVSLTGTLTTDGKQDFLQEDSIWTVGIAAPLSANCYLRGLQVKNATLSPNFSVEATRYDAGVVPFSVEALEIQATPQSGTAQISVEGNALQVGSNTVQILVTAEDGTQRVHQIHVVRQSDPMEQRSSDARLGGITVSDGILSPHFLPDMTTYVVYLPYEVETLTLCGTAWAPGGQGAAEKTYRLQVGENACILTSLAQDGTPMEYTVVAVRAPAYTGDNSSSGTAEKTEPPQRSWGKRELFIIAGVGIVLEAGILFLLLRRRPRHTRR